MQYSFLLAQPLRATGACRLKPTSAVSLILCLIMTSLPTLAVESKLPWETTRISVADRFSLELGAFGGSLDTTARVDFSPEFPGSEFSAESDFGLTESRLLYFPELTLLPGKRHMVRISGFSLRRNGHKALERDIDYDEDFFETGDLVDSTLDMDILETSYGYRFINHERLELDAILGVQLVNLTVNAEVRNITTRDPTGDLAPIPMAGIELRAHVSDKLAFELRGHYVSLSVDTIAGEVTDLRGAVTWSLSPHLLAGIGYRSFDLHAESNDEDSSGFVHLRMSGPLLFFRAGL